MSTTFECPRCQHRFVDASQADQAFAECPQCGSLALPGAAEAAAEARVLKSVSAQSMLSDEGAPLSSDADPTVAIPIPGVFSALLDSDVDGGPSVPSGEAPLVSDEGGGFSMSDSLEGDPTRVNPVPDKQKLPMSLLLTRGASAEGAAVEHDEDPSDPSFPTLPSLPSLPEQLAAQSVDGPPPMALSLEGSSPSLPRGGSAVAPTSEIGGFLDEATRDMGASAGSSALQGFDLGDLDIDLKIEAPTVRPAATRPSSARAAPTRAAPRPAPAASAPAAIPASLALTRDLPPGFDVTDEGAAVSDDRTMEVRTSPSSEGGALTLSELEQKLGGGGLDVATIFQQPGMLQDETFGALEQAFDEVSRRPPARPPKRDRVEAVAAAAPPVDEISLITLRGKGDVPAPPEKPTVPATKLRRRAEAPHLSLSDEAIALAAYRIGETEISQPGRNAPAGLDTSDDDMPAHLSEATDLVRPREDGVASKAAITDVHATPRGTRGKAKPLEDPNEKKSFFTFGRVVFLAFFMAAVGVGAGAATAPDNVDDTPSVRLNAIKQIAAGNRYFEEGRYDEALGAYRGALNSDRSYVQAHRAKAVALAKQRRYDEAAKSYEEYLAVSTDASDADLVKEILYRYHAGDDAK